MNNPMKAPAVETFAISFSNFEWGYTPFDATGQPGSR